MWRSTGTTIPPAFETLERPVISPLSELILSHMNLLISKSQESLERGRLRGMDGSYDASPQGMEMWFISPPWRTICQEPRSG